MDKQDIGRRGEDFCCEYYKKLGWSIIKRNYHSRYGEIDLIAENDHSIAFVEVKTRGDNRVAEAKDFVTPSKQRKIVLTALFYLSKNAVNKQPQFDVFEVLHTGGRIYQFNRIENAFEADEKLMGDYRF